MGYPQDNQITNCVNLCPITNNEIVTSLKTLEDKFDGLGKNNLVGKHYDSTNYILQCMSYDRHDTIQLGFEQNRDVAQRRKR